MVSTVFLLRNKWWWKFLMKKNNDIGCTLYLWFSGEIFLTNKRKFPKFSVLRNLLWQKKHRFPVHFITSNCFIFFWYYTMHCFYIHRIYLKLYSLIIKYSTFWPVCDLLSNQTLCWSSIFENKRTARNTQINSFLYHKIVYFFMNMFIIKDYNFVVI